MLNFIIGIAKFAVEFVKTLIIDTIIKTVIIPNVYSNN